MIRLNAEWTRLLREYKLAHAHPGNIWCHSIGIPMILASLPLGISVVGLPLAVPLFAVGWGFQFVGHYAYEKNDPQFFGDKRNLIVGAIWALQKYGVSVEEAPEAPAA